MMKTLPLSFALTAIMASSAFAATSGSHYPIGGEGVMAGTPPPPGVHYRMYNTWYSADKLTDNNGDDTGLDVDIDAYVQLHRLVHVTDKKLFGANWAYNVIVPMVHEKFSSDALGIHDNTSFSLGDVVLEPLALFWYGEEFDACLGLAAIAPTGDYDAHDAASAGMGFWSGMLTLGGTYYMGDNRSWSASILTRTIYNGKQDDTNIRPGAEFAVEGGIGKQFALNDRWLARPGISYGASWQISDDSKDAPGVVADHHKESYSVGAELNLMYLPWHLQGNLRYATEFGAKNTSEGSSVVFTLTKSF
ncbi:transporter [Ferrimonas sp. SCSIO 43195]|uniref:SphA family protein n=1 Tax=Ferrimonas sp. SCSIO 43195 TaxID=2822844 RepID=UPI002075095B|nr:transporter [Ferrimonas sp. SCSIO 43195]